MIFADVLNCIMMKTLKRYNSNRNLNTQRIMISGKSPILLQLPLLITLLFNSSTVSNTDKVWESVLVGKW